MDWDLIIFDCDGVLVDTEAVAHRLISEALRAAGIPLAADGAAAFLGGKLTLIKLEAEERLGRKLPDDWVDQIYARQFAEFRAGLQTITGIEHALDGLRAAGVPVCVGSNGPPHKMEVTLTVTDLMRRFEGRVFSADHVGVAKPAPDLYLYCADQMGAAASRCAVVEDSPRGASAGVAAGMTVFGYAGGADGGGEGAAVRDAANSLRAVGCTHVFTEMTALMELLQTTAPPKPGA